MIESDKISELISKYKITPTQVYILWLLYTEDTTNMEAYMKVFGQFEKKDFKDLEEKGLLLWTNRGAQSYITSDLVVTLEFVEELGKIDPEDAYEELFNVYPAWLVVNGNKYPAKSLTISDEKAVKLAYAKAISKGKFIHQKILASVNKWKERHGGYAIVKIDKFVTGRLWEEIDKEEDERERPRIY